MKNKEINKLSKDELKNKVSSLKKDLFNFRFRKVNGQLDDPSKVSKLKKDVAKLLTRLNKKNIHEYNFAYGLIKQIPEQSNLFIGNSLMIRAFDSFTDRNSKDIRIFSNRGTSGIDGNISTALGMANSSVKNNYLVIGDQSFMHDIGSLQILTSKNINLTIFIINNYGGAIFDGLPLSKAMNQPIFKKFIRCQHSYNFKKIIESYDLKYNEIHSIEDLDNNDLKLSGVNINEVFINSEETIRFLQDFPSWNFQAH